jgi:hypothetical protein
MQPNLPTDYYLDNVLILFEHVESLYRDIMPETDLEFLESFSGLTTNAKRLYIRLLNRSHVLFRLSKLNYTEIVSIPAAMEELNARDFLEVDFALERANLIRLFNKSELLSSHPQKTRLQKINRSELDVLLLESEEEYFLQLQASDQFIQVSRKECYQLCQMLFFGNLNQSMTDFVLRDLGLNRYEDYGINPQNRPYKSELEIRQHWLLFQLNLILEAADSDDVDSLITCFEAVPIDVDSDSVLYRHCERIKYQVARQLERLQQYELAMDYYNQCRLPPRRERMVRILSHQGDIDQALQLCEFMIEQPLAEEESQFASDFSERLAKRHGRKILRSSTTTISPLKKPITIDLILDKQTNVELAVAQYYSEKDSENTCIYVENALFNGVLGLLIWEVMFLPVAGAFYNDFQHRPSDFYAHDFLKKRQGDFDRLWSSLSSNIDILERVEKIWVAKNGLMNPLVNWSILDLPTIELALKRIDFSHWMAIFDRLLQDLRNNRSGFPDLILFSARHGYELIEVKGPGDTLQKNQKRWMTYFSQKGIPHSVARVSWNLES